MNMTNYPDKTIYKLVREARKSPQLAFEVNRWQMKLELYPVRSCLTKKKQRQLGILPAVQ